jgi:hypothetical protein
VLAPLLKDPSQLRQFEITSELDIVEMHVVTLGEELDGFLLRLAEPYDLLVSRVPESRFFGLDVACAFQTAAVGTEVA